MLGLRYYNGPSKAKRKKGDVLVFDKYALLGSQSLEEILIYFDDFLDKNPNEVVTLILDCSVKPEDVFDVFERHDIQKYLYRHDSDEWPTLGEMITTNQRLVVFSGMSNGSRDWYLDKSKHMFQNQAKNRTVKACSCEIQAGEAKTGNLFLLHRYIHAPLSRRVRNAKSNRFQNLMPFVRKCGQEVGQIPNFIAVEWYTRGDAFEVVKQLNGLR